MIYFEFSSLQIFPLTMSGPSGRTKSSIVTAESAASICACNAVYTFLTGQKGTALRLQ
jgi:hypothetical protein